MEPDLSVPGGSHLSIRAAVLPADREAIRRLWLEYLTWGNDELQRLHGVHPHAPAEAVESDLAHIDQFQPPAGQLALA